MTHIPENMPRPSLATMAECDDLIRVGISYSDIAKSLGVRTRVFKTLVWIFRGGNYGYLPTSGGPDLSREVRIQVTKGRVTRSRRIKLMEGD